MTPHDHAPDATWTARELRLHLADEHGDVTRGLSFAELAERHGAGHGDE